MLKTIFDMETSDPDDIITLMLLCDHPLVDLRAVTVTPGSVTQIGLVRHVLSLFDKEIPVGAFNIAHPKECVSGWHYKVFGPIEPSKDARPGWEVIRENSGDVTLVTGAPLKNMRGLVNGSDWTLDRWVAQGGFAGEGVVPPHLQLEKFKGKRTCPTFNFNGDPQTALDFLNENRITSKLLVSKNVCHGVVYEKTMHEQFEDNRNRLSLELVWKAMNIYLADRPAGKMFHDPLAAMCAINEDIGQWKEVKMFRDRGEWGAEPSPGSNVKIIVDYDKDLFLKTLFS